MLNLNQDGKSFRLRDMDGSQRELSLKSPELRKIENIYVCYPLVKDPYKKST